MEEETSHDRRLRRREERAAKSAVVLRKSRVRDTLFKVALGIVIVSAGVGIVFWLKSVGGDDAIKPAPSWEATSIDGKFYSGASLKGDVYAVDFFFTWCPICASQYPHKEALVNHFSERSDFHFLSVSADPSDSPGVLRQYRDSHGATWPFFQDRTGLYQKFGVDSRPFIVFVDRQGMIVKTIRALTESDKLIRIVESLLAEPRASPDNSTTPAANGASGSPGRPHAGGPDASALSRLGLSPPPLVEDERDEADGQQRRDGDPRDQPGPGVAEVGNHDLEPLDEGEPPDDHAKAYKEDEGGPGAKSLARFSPLATVR